jgi:uncharacterized protein DUF4424
MGGAAMSKGFLAVSAALAGFIFTPAAFANDSTAELTTGGLVLAKSADIEMRSEDLAISENQISVRYRFFNHAASDQTVTVAFPMPDVTLDGPDSNIAFPAPDSTNFLEFHTTADGREVQAQYEQKAVLGGVDISAKLKAYGIPLAPQSEATNKALDALPRATQDELVKLGYGTPYDDDVGKGWVHHVIPAWTFESTFYWSQTFPAGREIVVEHRYTPSLGETVGTILDSPDIDPAQLRQYETRYCIDKDFMAGVRAALAKPGAAVFYEKRIAYVLKTAANWDGPIGDFRLTVDKGAPDSLVSFCADGVKKIGPTLFEVRHANFTPTQDLHILILFHPKT